MSYAKKYIVALTPAQRQQLTDFVGRGQPPARAVTRARILLLADAGQPDRVITETLGVARQTVSTMRQRYAQTTYTDILDILQDAPRSGRPVKLDSRVDSQITLIACSDPPPGFSRWSLHMIADELIRLELVDTISHERVRQTLKKTVSSRG